MKHCERFPATGELSLILSHDERVENLLVIYRLEILPIFFRFLGSDHEAFPLEVVDEKRLAERVDQRLLAFVDTYLRLEETDQYQSENLVTDPVCGMRINKLYSAAGVEDRGREFYFCTEGCRSKFVENPDTTIGSQALKHERSGCPRWFMRNRNPSIRGESSTTNH